LDPGFRILNPVSEFIDPVFSQKKVQNARFSD